LIPYHKMKSKSKLIFVYSPENQVEERKKLLNDFCEEHGIQTYSSLENIIFSIRFWINKTKKLLKRRTLMRKRLIFLLKMVCGFIMGFLLLGKKKMKKLRVFLWNILLSVKTKIMLFIKTQTQDDPFRFFS
jgi:hypothetical protein